MTDDVSAKLEELHAEIKALRHEQAVTRRIVSTAAMRHHWARHLVSDGLRGDVGGDGGIRR